MKLKKLITVFMVAVMCCTVPGSAAAADAAVKKPVSVNYSAKKLVVKKSVTLKVKKSKGVTIKSKSFSSSNKKVAKVTKKGKVIAVKSGKAVIKTKVKYKYKGKMYIKTFKTKITVYKNANALKSSEDGNPDSNQSDSGKGSSTAKKGSSTSGKDSSSAGKDSSTTEGAATTEDTSTTESPSTTEDSSTTEHVHDWKVDRVETEVLDYVYCSYCKHEFTKGEDAWYHIEHCGIYCYNERAGEWLWSGSSIIQSHKVGKYTYYYTCYDCGETKTVEQDSNTVIEDE